MTTETKFTLPWPPSVNNYWRNVQGRVYVTQKGKEYRWKVVEAVKDVTFAVNESDRLALAIWAFPPDRRKRDLDNSFKAPLDALQFAKVFPDDSQIDRLVIERGSVVDEGLLDIWIGIIPEGSQ